jgi:hypothetical protein
LSRWVGEGLDPESFWRQTPRTFAAVMDGRVEAAQQRHRENAWLAWHSGALSQWNPRRFPKLADLSGDRQRAQARQSPEQMMHSMRLWKRALKGR